MPVWHQAIIWTNDGLSTLGNKFQWKLNHNTTIFIKENGFENVYKMTAILFGPQGVNINPKKKTKCEPILWDIL